MASVRLRHAPCCVCIVVLASSCPQCLIQAISAAVVFNTAATWEELYALPKCVLRAQDRGGKGRNRGEVETKQLCRRWLEGQRTTLWNCVRESKFASRNDSNSWAEVASGISDRDTERILELVGMGLPHRCSSPLCSWIFENAYVPHRFREGHAHDFYAPLLYILIILCG